LDLRLLCSTCSSSRSYAHCIGPFARRSPPMYRPPAPPRSLVLLVLVLIGLVIASLSALVVGWRPFAWLDATLTVADMIILWLALSLWRTFAEIVRAAH